jgi:hypothetical protein
MFFALWEVVLPRHVPHLNWRFTPRSWDHRGQSSRPPASAARLSFCSPEDRIGQTLVRPLGKLWNLCCRQFQGFPRASGDFAEAHDTCWRDLDTRYRDSDLIDKKSQTLYGLFGETGKLPSGFDEDEDAVQLLVTACSELAAVTKIICIRVYYSRKIKQNHEPRKGHVAKHSPGPTDLSISCIRT